MAINKLPGFGALDLNNQEVINGLNVIPLYEEGAAYGIGDQVIFREKDEDGNDLPPRLYTFNEQVDTAPSTFPMDMVTDAGTIVGAGESLPTTDITNDEAVLGELFSLTANDNGRLPGLYRRIADDSGVAAWANIVDQTSVNAALGVGSGTLTDFYNRNGEWMAAPNTTYVLGEDTDEFESDGTTKNANFNHIELTGSDSAVTRVPLGARQATFIPGSTDEQGIFLSLTRNGVGLPSGSAEFVNTVTRHGEMHVEESPYIDWEVAGGRGALNSTGLHNRFDDTYRKNEIENWVEHEIPVEPKPAIQYYEVLGNPNFDSAAPVGTVDAERVEFSEFAVDLGLQRRTGAVSDYHSKAISFTLTETQASDNAGHWTISAGLRGTIFVIKDDVYKEFRLNDAVFNAAADPLLTCIAFDPLSIPGVHNEQLVRVGAQQGVIYTFKLSELNKNPGDDKVITATRSQTSFPNEAITAIATQTHFDGKNDNVHTLAFGTSQGHLSYVSQFINDLTAVDEYILDFDTTNPLLPIPFDLRFPAASHATSAYPANTAKDNVWIREIKWIGQAAEFIAVGDHQASTRQFAGIPGDALGAPLVAYFRNIQATASLEDGDIYYLTTPFSELFFDNLVGLRDGSSTPEPLSNGTGADPDANDGTNLPTLNQLFGTAFTSVIPVTIGSQDWVYFFGKRDIHVNNQYSSSRAFCIKARLDGTLSIIEAINNHDATNGLEPIEGFIQWELVNVISEVTGWQHGGSFGLQPLNHAQQRFNVQGGNNFIGLLDDKIIDIFGDGRTVIDLDVSDTNGDNSGEDVLTFSQEAEDDLAHDSNGWAQTDVIWGGWIGNVGDNININLEYQTLTIMGQSGNGGTTPLYGISRYVVDLSLILRPLNGDPSITVGPIRVPDATGTKLIDNVLSPFLSAYFSSATTGKVAGESASISTFDENYRVASIEFSSARNFDVSIKVHDPKQVVNVDNDTYEFTLKYAQRFVAGSGDLEYELRYPRRFDSGNSNYPTIADEVTLFESDGTTELDKDLYSISIAADTAGELTRLNIRLATDANVGLPQGTIVAIDYGYDSSIFYDFAHEVATSIDIMDQYYPGHGGSFQIPLGMTFADTGALTAYLVTKFTEILDEREVEVIQEGNSNVIEFRTNLRGDAVTDLILDDDQKFVVTTHNPVDVANPQVQGNLMVPRLFDGRSDFPGKFASTFDFDNAITDTDFRSVLHQVFAETGTAGSGFNIPVATSTGDEVINGANTSLYNDDRLITESNIANQVISNHIAGTQSSAFSGSVDFLNGTSINATGTTWDFNGATLNNLDGHININEDAYTYPFSHAVTFEHDDPITGTSSIEFASHADFIEFITELQLPTDSGSIVTQPLDISITYTIGVATFTIPAGIDYSYDPPTLNSTTSVFFDSSDITDAPVDGTAGTLTFAITGYVREVTNLEAGTAIDISIIGNTARINYDGATGGGLSTVATDTTISGTGVNTANALSVVYGTGINTALQGNAVHIGGLGTPGEGDVPFHTGGNWTLSNRISGTRVVDVSVGSHGVPVDHIAWLSDTEQYVNNTASGEEDVTNAYDFVGEGWLRLGAAGGGIVKSVTVGAVGSTQSFNTTTGELAIAESFTGGGGEGDVTEAGDNVFTGNNVFEIDNGTKGFEIAEYTNDSTNGPALVIDRKRQTTPGSSSTNAPAVDGDDIGVIRFQGNDDKSGTNVTYASIGATIDNAKDDNPVGQLYIKVADGTGAGGGKAGSHIRIEGKDAGGATIEVDSDSDLTVDGTTTLNGTIVTNGPLTSDSVHVVSGTGHQLRSDANTILNGLVTGSGITTFTSAVLANRGIRSAVAGSGISITPSADGFSETFTSSNTVAQGNISIPSDSGIITATGDRDNIQRFLDRAGLLRYVDLTDNTPIEAAPVRLNGRLLNNIRTEAESDVDFFFNNATQETTKPTQGSAFEIEWDEIASVVMMGNPNNVSVEHWLLGDSLFIYQPNEARDRWAVYRVDSVGTTTSGDQYANLTYVNSHGTPDISSTGSRDGDDAVVIGSLRDVVPDGAAFQYSTVIAFDSADGIKYRDTLDALTVEGVFDLIGSGIASNGTDITSAGNFNGAPVNAMAYLAIQLNSFQPVQVDASTTLSTVYANETVIAGGASEDVAITYQAILDGSAAATGGIVTDFDNYIYVLYKSVYNNNIAAIFLDRIDGNGTTFTTHSFAQGGATSTIQTVVVPQSL